MTLSAKRLALALQGIPLLEKCQPMQSDEQPDERSHSPSGQPPPPTKDSSAATTGLCTICPYSL